MFFLLSSLHPIFFIQQDEIKKRLKKVAECTLRDLDELILARTCFLQSQEDENKVYLMTQMLLTFLSALRQNLHQVYIQKYLRLLVITRENQKQLFQ